MAIPSKSSLSEDGSRQSEVGFSPDVVILDVVLLGLAYQQSHLSGVNFLCIIFLDCPARFPLRPNAVLSLDTMHI